MVLVVSIIGVLSAIAVPRLSRGAAGSEYAAQHRDWQTVQKQIELFAVEHFGIYPAGVGDGANAQYTAAAFGRHIEGYTDVNGNASAAKGGAYIYGPYLRDGLPAIHYGPHAGLRSVKVISGATAPAYTEGAAAGWIYNATTGDIIPNVPARTDTTTINLPLVDFDRYGDTELGGEAIEP